MDTFTNLPFGAVLTRKRKTTIFSSKNKYLPGIIILFSLIVQSNAQLYQVSRGPLQSRIGMDFSKLSNSWDWMTRLQFAKGDYNNWLWQFNESFHSNLLIPVVGHKAWRDENFLDGVFYRQFKNFSVGTYVKSWYQSDKQVSADNQFGNHVMGISAAFQKNKRIYLTPFVGYQQSKNRTLIDWGWDMGMRGDLSNLKTDIYTANINFLTSYDIFEERQNHDNNFSVKLSGKFSPITRDSLNIDYDESQREYFSTGAETIIRSRIEKKRLFNTLYYDLTPRNLFLLRTNLQSSRISYYTDRDIFFIENQLRYLHYGNRFQYAFSLRTNDETQTTSDIRTDSRTRQTAMDLSGKYLYNPDNTFNLSFAYIKLQYDTPDTLYNNNDRDEQRFVTTMIYFHRFSSVLWLNFYAYAYFFHQIYIFKERSIDNNWNNIYKLNPRVVYREKNIRNQVSAQVLANYTIYDFDTPETPLNSFLFRKFVIADSALVRLHGAIHAGINFRIELEDKGNFYPQIFAQRVIESYKVRFYDFFLMNKSLFNFKVTIGYTLFERRQWKHIPVKTLTRVHKNSGPYIRAYYNLRRNLYFSLYTAFSVINDSYRSTENYASGYLSLHYTF